MNQFESVFAELQSLQTRLMATVNRIWAIHRLLTAAYRQGHQEGDFLPRRLISLRQEEQKRFDQLVRQVNLLVSNRLDSTLMILSKDDDFETMLGIRKTLRYIRNAFAAELPLGRLLAGLGRSGN